MPPTTLKTFTILKYRKPIMCENYNTCSGPKTSTKYCPLRPFISKKLVKIETEDDFYKITYEMHVENQSSTVEPIRLLQIWDSGIYVTSSPVVDLIVTGAPPGDPVPVVTQSVNNSLLPMVSIDQLVLGGFMRARLTIKIDKATTCLFNNSFLIRSGDQQPLFPPFYITESIDFKQTICVNGQICKENYTPE